MDGILSDYESFVKAANTIREMVKKGSVTYEERVKGAFLITDMKNLNLKLQRATKELTEDVINFGNKVSEKGTNHHTTAYKIAQINKVSPFLSSSGS